MKNKWILLSIIAVGFVTSTPCDIHGEFYKYLDRDGHVRYVDDITQIPDEYHENVKIYKEPFDDLPEAERAARIRELEQQQAPPQTDDGKNEFKQLESSVVIEGNQVLVPVTLSYGMMETQTMLLLDTGASIMALHRDVANRLFIPRVHNARARTAGGQHIETQVITLNYIKFGPYTKTKVLAGIIDHEGIKDKHSGLLGMNILRDFEYSIDFKNQTIRWTHRENNDHD